MVTELETGPVIMAVICWVCGIIFLSIGIFACRSKKPMHFWAGTTVSPEKITDIAAYNKANALLWTAYSVPYFLIGCLGLVLDTIIAGLLIVVAAVGGIPVLILSYLKISAKYQRK